MSTAKENTIIIFRFVVILPSAILIYLIFRGLINIILNFSWSQNSDYPFMLKYIAPIICNAVGGYWSILVSVLIAPFFKKITAVFITILYFILFFIILYFFSRNQVFTFSTLIEQIGLLIGASIGTYYSIKNNK